MISGYNGIYAGGDAATVINAGTIAGYTTSGFGFGVVLWAGGSVTNQSGGVISGDGGIEGGNTAVTVVNAGRIVANSNGPLGGGAYLNDGGSVTNQTGGAISGYEGIVAWGDVTVVNAGTIATTKEGIFVHQGGSVTNQSGGSISGNFGIFATSLAATVVNAGSIAGSTTDALGSGVYLTTAAASPTKAAA